MKNTWIGIATSVRDWGEISTDGWGLDTIGEAPWGWILIISRTTPLNERKQLQELIDPTLLHIIPSISIQIGVTY